MTTQKEYKQQWNTQIETLNRLKWNLPLEHHDELDEKISELKELVAKAADERGDTLNECTR